MTTRCPAPTTVDGGFRGFGELTFEEYCARVLSFEEIDRDMRNAIDDAQERESERLDREEMYR